MCSSLPLLPLDARTAGRTEPALTFAVIAVATRGDGGVGLAADIDAVSQIQAVVLDGRVLPRDALDALLDCGARAQAR